ncbi:hypothetical protein OV207_01080 [Corallococcus sp. BB11-1]|uniref:hypothetical protein n=1 Tax=Corallococcus sp. BB11-1 TaxID=2996783 RepID=UPI00226EE696|nr:hypothetical protein [Corallococcus sp. BB11-1]MCY1030038.1 hypothetical protein [Corallococcus sp. BB11-1]
MATSKRGLVEQVKRAVTRVGTRGARALVETALGTASATVRTVDSLQAKLGRKKAAPASRRNATTVRKLEVAKATPAMPKAVSPARKAAAPARKAAAPARKAAAPARKAVVRKTGSKVVAAPAAAKRRTASKATAAKKSAGPARKAAKTARRK